MTVASDLSAFDVFRYEKPSGESVHAALSPKAERAILKSVNLDQLVGLSNRVAVT